MIIDGEIVITGSFNFTKTAEEKNAENLLIIRDNWYGQTVSERLPSAQMVKYVAALERLTVTAEDHPSEDYPQEVNDLMG